MEKISPGKKFRQKLNEHQPLQILGTINAYIAIMAEQIGFKAIYLSGAGVANSSYGLPDLGLTTLDNVLEDVRRITAAVDLPLIVDIDTGWGSALMIERSIKSMIRAGAAGVHIEDQVFHKRCGHRPDKSLISREEMCERVHAADNSRRQIDPDFYLIARTDAYANEGLEGVIERGLAYKEAGADALFPEALTVLEDYSTLKKEIDLPILANLTEFGKTPLYSLDELKSAHVEMVLYPLSVNRAMNQAAWMVLEEIYKNGTQRGMLDKMQTREQLYHFLKYEELENKLNRLLE
ncbi:MAG: methylisocitrate lyase [Chlamydiales bacterium 38-26]|nr:methylisocitrate lyase [Chlamydiales bacterium]OJV10877.1 MAG: methylisocitrate lyase [Chlamydiales bacterium 38-26]